MANNYASELENDPLGLGYAALLDLGDADASGDDAAVAALLNAPGSDRLPRESIPAGFIAKAILLPAQLILAGNDALQAKWGKVLETLAKVPGLDAREPHVVKMLGDLLADGLITQEAADNLATRPATRAESLFGAGTRCDPSEISASPGRDVAGKRATVAVVAAEKWKADTKAALVQEAKRKLANLMQGKIVEETPTDFIPASDPFSAALQAVLDAGEKNPSDAVLESLAHAEMMRVGGGKE